MITQYSPELFSGHKITPSCFDMDIFTERRFEPSTSQSLPRIDTFEQSRGFYASAYFDYLSVGFGVKIDQWTALLLREKYYAENKDISGMRGSLQFSI